MDFPADESRASQNLVQQLASHNPISPTMPNRCPLAPENAKFSQEIRQLIYGSGRNAYRILFTVLDQQNPLVVRILHIRHVSRPPLPDKN